MNLSYRGVFIVGAIAVVLILFFTFRGPHQPVIVDSTTSSTLSPPVTTILYVPGPYDDKSPDEVLDDIKSITELVESRDENDCVKIDVTLYPGAVSMCYYQVAVTERNETKCAKIPDVGLQQTCREQIAYHTQEVVYKKNWSYLFEDKT